MISGYSIYEIIFLFFIYSFLGWCIEVIYCGLDKGHFINRGFLNGPVCPIYGAGGTSVVLCLTPVQNNIPILFICSVLLTSALELITGFALDKIFHARWWDYSDKPFNIGGYICLKFSVYWGFICIALIKGIHPVIIGLVRLVPFILGAALLVIFSAFFITDTVVTVITINDLAKHVKLMNEMAERMHAFSDELGEHIYDGAVKVADKGIEIYNSDDAKELREKYASNVDEIKQKRDDLISHRETELAELKEKYAASLQPRMLRARIIKAFPNLKLHSYNEQLEKIREKLR